MMIPTAKSRSIADDAANLMKQFTALDVRIGEILNTRAGDLSDDDRKEIDDIKLLCATAVIDLGLVAAMPDPIRAELGVGAYHTELVALSKKQITQIRMTFAEAEAAPR